MKRWLCYLCTAAAAVGLSTAGASGRDIGKLQPVQVVYMARVGGDVLLQTDTGDWGQGDTLLDAVDDMKASATGEIFLDTADYLLLSPECEVLLPEATEFLRPSCAVCLTKAQPDMEQVGTYLQLHSPRVTLNQYRAGNGQLQTLMTQKGRMELVS